MLGGAHYRILEGVWGSGGFVGLRVGWDDNGLLLHYVRPLVICAQRKDMILLRTLDIDATSQET